MNIKQLTKEQAIALYQSGEWKDYTDDEIVRLQLYQDRVCLPWDRFCQAIEVVLGRGVYTHEFADDKALKEEYEKKRPAPTFEEIMNKIPKDKQVIVVLAGGGADEQKT